MDIDLFGNGLSEEDTVEVVPFIDNLSADGERCGICMDVIIDRGVLDCCQHWFCFGCIDNWATIANLCPLCQNEFQLITCVPVFDTGDNDKDSDSRDDDWCLEGKNNLLSFPSYYIDENAVTCLDGDGCKLRNGSVPYEETLSLDTSIACDSCDIWYHAFCVGFDPQGTCVDSWLCARCLANEAGQKSDPKKMYNSGTNADPRHMVDTSSGKVCTCVEVSNRKFTDNHHEVEKILMGIKYSSEMKKSLDQGMNSIQLEPMFPLTKLKDIVIESEPVDSESRMSFDPGQSFASKSANNSPGQNGFMHDALSDENLEDLKADIGPRFGDQWKRQRRAEF